MISKLKQTTLVGMLATALFSAPVMAGFTITAADVGGDGQVFDDEFTLAEGGIPGATGNAGVGVTATSGSGMAIVYDTSIVSGRQLGQPFWNFTVGAMKAPDSIIAIQDDAYLSGCGTGVCDQAYIENTGGTLKFDFEGADSVVLQSLDVFGIAQSSGSPALTISMYSDFARTNQVAYLENFGTVAGSVGSETITFSGGVANVRALDIWFAGIGGVNYIEGAMDSSANATPVAPIVPLMAIGLVGFAATRRKV
jgi:hypothetical protein